jgi:hypothetical protein
VALVDLDFRHKLINVDGASAFDLNGVKLLVLNNEVLAFGNFIAARCVLPGDYSAVSESTFCCLNRLPVFRLSRLKLIFSLSDEAG